MEAKGKEPRNDRNPRVTIYTSNDCRWCGVAKQYLSERGVPFNEKNVELDELAGMEAMRLAGQRRTPIITVGDRVIVGFQRRELDATLGLESSSTVIRSEDS
jgi:glutaredoxin